MQNEKFYMDPVQYISNSVVFVNVEQGLCKITMLMLASVSVLHMYIFVTENLAVTNLNCKHMQL